ncbi:MAG TPA: glycosyltransferase [Anaerolineae bacterium]|nr:glycosyltransferase [Anaerolineae bacterium]
MDFVFLSTQGWTEMGGAGRPLHFLARELLQRGERVLFVEVVASNTTPSDANFTLLNFKTLGFDERALRRAWFGLDPQMDFSEAFTRALAAFEARHVERVVIYGDPFVPFLAWFPLFRARGYKIVYDALDDFEAFPEIGLYFANRDAEQYLVAHSDLVVAVSTTLVKKLAQWEHRAPIQLLRQGFDPTTFPVGVNFRVDPIQSRKPKLGFWGHVNAFNIDVTLIEYLARERPDWTIQLMGPIDQDSSLPRVGDRLRVLPNVQFVGAVPHDKLPSYLKSFDVALVPFPDNAFNRARDPLKVFEYLSGCKPVVAAHTPQLAGMPYVLVADSPQDYLAAVERALALDVDCAQVRAYLETCTWSARLDQLLTWLAQIVPAPNSPIPNVNLWYADASLTKNIQEYVSRTEQLLNERIRYAKTLESQARTKQAQINQLQGNNLLWRLKQSIMK